MARPVSSSIRVSGRTRQRVSDIAERLRASTQQEVIEKALDALEESLFWEGFDEEADRYIHSYPEEEAERKRFEGTMADGLRDQP